jgi:hypothetical protein
MLKEFATPRHSTKNRVPKKLVEFALSEKMLKVAGTVVVPQLWCTHGIWWHGPFREHGFFPLFILMAMPEPDAG